MLTLDQYADNLRQEVLLEGDESAEGEFLENAFTKIITSRLVEAGETDGAIVCGFRAKGMKVDAYGLDDDQTRLDLFVSEYMGAQGTIPHIERAEIQKALHRATSFLEYCLAGKYKDLEESSLAFDLGQTVHDLQSDLDSIRIIYITNGRAAAGNLPEGTVRDYRLYFDVWDIERLYRLETSGLPQEPIEVDLIGEYQCPLPCLSVSRPSDGYEAYLTMIPGEVLAGIYQRYGPRLLERNVRSFLQVRGKVNKGIRDTILKHPSWFLAYNNGISATADEVRLIRLPSGVSAIGGMKNLQIVNGGQTTASLCRANVHDKADMSKVFVQCKLCVVPQDKIETVVPLISRYANTQNKVNEADFWANDAFHVELEKLSRTIWAPAPHGTNLQTHWFYERARGQYADARSKAGTPAETRRFDLANPKNQRFTKTDLAKFANSWAELPYLVSLGAEKNFRHFALALGERSKQPVSGDYFQDLVAKAILFRETERVVESMELGGYRANIVAYTVSYLAFRTAQRIDLDAIWRTQTISGETRRTMELVGNRVRGVITNPPGGKNVTEWCKRKECWDQVKELSVDIDMGSLRTVGTSSTGGANLLTLDPEDVDRIERVALIPAESWFELSGWAKQTANLLPWERSLAFSLGGCAVARRKPSAKQALHGERIMKQAVELGFKTAFGEQTSDA